MIGVPSTSRNNETTATTIMNTKEKEKYIEEYDFPYCDEATKYEKVAKIGQGTFGYVHLFDKYLHTLKLACEDNS